MEKTTEAFEGFRSVKTVDGLDKIFESDAPEGSIIIITGEPGSLKSTFAYILLSRYLDSKDERGLYVTFEEEKTTHMANLKSMKVKLSDRVEFSDIAQFRVSSDFPDREVNYFDSLNRVIDNFISGEGKKSCMVVDSLNALIMLGGVEEAHTRQECFRLFKKLQGAGLTSFFMLEKSKLHHYDPMEYLADGIIEMGMTRSTLGQNVRYLHVRKMRGCKHSLDRHLIEAQSGKEAIKIIGPLQE